MPLQYQGTIVSKNLISQSLGYGSTFLIKKGIWLYFLLLIFEGALRKWVFPGLATPILVIRDPIALFLIYLAWKKNLFPANAYLSFMLLIGIISIYTALFVGHGNLLVALFGARILLLHFPLMFIIGNFFDRGDVLMIGKMIIYMAFPMVILIGFQFFSPQTSFVNRGVGGDMEGAGFDGAMGFFRPPGTFSFTNGTTLFFGLLTAYIFYFWFNTKQINKVVLIIATTSLLFSIPLSISRSLLFHVLISILFVIIAVAKNPRYFFLGLFSFVGVVIIVGILLQTDYFSTAFEAFITRFENASEAEGGLKGTLIERFLGSYSNAILNSDEVPFWGYGLGMGTNAGSVLMTGSRDFIIAEDEWGRLIGEMGLFLGLGVILIRIGVVVKLTLASFQKVMQGDFLPWFLLSFGLLTILQSQWAQPTALGFSTLIGGLIIASFNHPSTPTNT